MADRYNIPNIYVDLIHKIKQIEGVDIEYIDKLVGLLYQDINIIDNALTGVIDMIPEGASSNNKFATASDISTLSGSIGSIQEVIPEGASSTNTLATDDDLPRVVNRAIGSTDWTLNGSYYEVTLQMHGKASAVIMSIDPPTPPASATMIADYNLISHFTFTKTGNVTNVTLYAKAVPSDEIDLQFILIH